MIWFSLGKIKSCEKVRFPSNDRSLSDLRVGGEPGVGPGEGLAAASRAVARAVTGAWGRETALIPANIHTRHQPMSIVVGLFTFIFKYSRTFLN